MKKILLVTAFLLLGAFSAQADEVDTFCTSMANTGGAIMDARQSGLSNVEIYAITGTDPAIVGLVEGSFDYPLGETPAMVEEIKTLYQLTVYQGCVAAFEGEVYEYYYDEDPEPRATWL